MSATAALLVFAPGDGAQLGAQGSQVGVLHLPLLSPLALLGLHCCHSCCQVVIILRLRLVPYGAGPCACNHPDLQIIVTNDSFKQRKRSAKTDQQ